MVNNSLQRLHIQSRDTEILRGLFESRLMTSRHIAGLYFEGRTETAKKRIQKFKAAGLIGEQVRHVNEPAILYLTQKGFKLLNDAGLLQGYPDVSPTAFRKRAQISPLTRAHELEVLDVKTAFYAALRNSEHFIISEFSTWPALHRFTAYASYASGSREREINPDGFIRITRRDGSGEFFFYLEVDRSNETQDILAIKAACYVGFYKSGGFAERLGFTKEDVEQFPFRILIVCKNAERRNNACARMLTFSTPIYRQAWLTTFQEVTTNPLGAIWICPLDYGNTTKGTRFDPYRNASNAGYRTDKEREHFIEERIQKHRLLA